MTLQGHDMHTCFHACTDLVPGQHAVRHLTPTNPDMSWPCRAGESAELQVDPTILASLWPSKIACAAAQSLLRNCNAGIDTQSNCVSLLYKQCLSQSLMFALPMRPHTGSQHVNFVFQDVNPDMDTSPTGTAFLAWHEENDVAAYDEAGRYAGTLPYQSVCKLAHLHLGAGLALQELPRQVAALLRACFTVTRRRDAHRHILVHHSSYEPALLDDLATALRLTIRWLASSLTCGVSIPGFAGACSEQATYGHGVDAYEAKWTGCGLVNPPLAWITATELFNGHLLRRMTARLPAS